MGLLSSIYSNPTTMKIQLFNILLLSIFTFSSCTSENGSEQASTADEATALSPEEAAERDAWEAMMVIHDDVMPKMSELNRTARALKEQAQSVSEDEAQAEIAAAVQKIEAASEGMMSWMADIKHPDKLRDSLSHTAVMKYMEKETAKIAQVREDMLHSLENGQSLISKFSPAVDQ